MATKRNKYADNTWTAAVLEGYAVAYESATDPMMGLWRDEEADAMPGCPPGCLGNCPPGCCGFQFGPDDPDLQSPLGLA